MPNPYRDQIGRYTSRYGLLTLIKQAAQDNDVHTYLELRDILKEADTLTNYQAKVEKEGIPAALALKDDDIEERERVIATGDPQEIEAFVEERGNRPEFVQLLELRDAAKEKAREVHNEYLLLSNVSKQDPNFDYELVRQKGFESLEAYEELQVIKNHINEYKDITAPAVAVLSAKIREEAEANGTFRNYTEDTLNNLQATGEFPSGSREWLEQRQNGIGGSDVGKIVGVNTDRRADDYREVLESKINPITDEEVAEQNQNHGEYTGYAGRGNAWEDYIAHKFAQNNPDANITHCKTSWQNKDVPYQFANFDGLMADENGKPNGILEIKTGSDPTKWGDPRDGLDAVPPQYRAQVLWYTQAAGFEKGAIAVVLDDREYREYHFKMTPELKAEAHANLQRVDEFVQEVNSRKNGLYSEPAPRINKGFGTDMISKAASYQKEAFAEASVYREESITETTKRFQQLCPDTSDPEQVKEALATLYTEKPLSDFKKPIVSIDLETSSTHPTKGHIIELGISVSDPTGEKETKKIAQLYGLSKKALQGVGTGAVEVHGITPGKIAKKARFYSNTEKSKQHQKEVLETLKSGIMLAHNAQYEIRWLRQHLDGFAEAYRKGQIKVLDTMSLSRRLVPETDNNKLESLVEHFGMPYENAHRAYEDANMTRKAFSELRKKLNG